MDESWRMPTFSRRRSMENPAAAAPTRHSMEVLDPDDFADVFGGPPRSVLSRKLSGDFAAATSFNSSTAVRSNSYSSFYEDVFRQPEFFSRSKNSGGRILPAFRIPARDEGFYSDVFGSNQFDGGRRSRERSRPNSKSKSKSNSSSVLSSEELSPLRRPVHGDDVALSSFASKLRPINVPCRWNSTTMRPEEPQRKTTYYPSSFGPENLCMENGYNENFGSSYFRFSRQVSSPETISLEPNSYRSVKISMDDLEPNSPSSPASSLCQEPEPKPAGIPFSATLGEEIQDDEEDEDDEVMSSYVIEINSDYREGNGEAVSIDEAIAWAKEKFQAQSFDKQQQNSTEAEERSSSQELGHQRGDHGQTQSSMEEELKKWKTEEDAEQSDKDVEMELLDEDIKLWSSGKETNIRLLLSTLHHILWPKSGWHAISVTSLIESSQVKKAYQKARLCLHPDKLQQRGASVPQKYVAEKAFSILQDAWAAFISQDVLF